MKITQQMVACSEHSKIPCADTTCVSCLMKLVQVNGVIGCSAFFLCALDLSWGVWGKVSGSNQSAVQDWRPAANARKRCARIPLTCRQAPHRGVGAFIALPGSKHKVYFTYQLNYKQ